MDHYASVRGSQDREECPEHMVTLLEQALKVCKVPAKEAQVQWMLTAYADAFSRSEADIIKTNLVKHCIPVDQGTVPIQQPPQKVGPEKD